MSIQYEMKNLSSPSYSDYFQINKRIVEAQVFHRKILSSIYRLIKMKLGAQNKVIVEVLGNLNIYSILDNMRELLLIL